MKDWRKTPAKITHMRLPEGETQSFAEKWLREYLVDIDW